MYSLKDYLKVLDQDEEGRRGLTDIDKESGGLLSSLEKKEDSKTNKMTNYANLLSRPTTSATYKYQYCIGNCVVFHL